MEVDFNLLDLGYTKPSESAIKKVIEAFKSWMYVGGFIVGGGVAGRIHLVDQGQVPPVGEFENIDLIVENLRAIPAGILRVKGFWLAFKNFEFINIWDSEHGIRIHVFTTHFPSEKHIVWRKIESIGWVQVVEKNWLFARMLIDLQRVLDPFTVPVDPKQFAMVKALKGIINDQEVDDIWRNHFDKHTGYKTWHLLWDQVMQYEKSPRVVADPFGTGKGKKRIQKLMSIIKWAPYVIYKRVMGGNL